MQVNNLSELLTQLIERTVNLPEKEAFGELRNLLGDGIRFRVEAPKADNAPRRVLLTSIRLHADHNRELSRQCNGVVIEYPSWKVLAVPAPAFNPQSNIAYICDNIHKYRVYDIKDGTTITLYWSAVNNSWVMSSANSFDAGGYYWMGNATYLTVFNLVAAAYPSFTYDNLDKNYSYTIGFRHPNFHPLLTDEPKMWFIQTCDLSQINAPDHRVVLSDIVPNIGIPSQTLSAVPNVKGKQLVAWISHRNIGAYQRYLRSIKEGAAADIHYGFVLRSTCGESDHIIESDLLQFIRSLMYNLPKKQNIGAVVINENNRQDYSALRAFLTPAARYRFINLFPQFVDKYRYFEQHFNALSGKIISILQQQKPQPIQSPSQIDILAAQLAAHIQSQENINVLGADGPGIVMDFILDKNYLDIYYTYLICPPKNTGRVTNVSLPRRPPSKKQ